MLKVSSSYKGKFYIKEGTTCISKEAFNWCENITEIVIPDSVTHIEDYAFHLAKSLKKIVIPKNVTFVGRNILFHCDLLKSLIILNPKLEIDEEAICPYSCPKNLVIYAEEGSTAHKYAVRKNIPFEAISDGKEDDDEKEYF